MRLGFQNQSLCLFNLQTDRTVLLSKLMIAFQSFFYCLLLKAQAIPSGFSKITPNLGDVLPLQCVLTYRLRPVYDPWQSLFLSHSPFFSLTDSFISCCSYCCLFFFSCLLCTFLGSLLVLLWLYSGSRL